jgi:hypothetical protein
MPLSFLNPGLLFGLLAAALPVIIHFLSRRRTRRVAFSDLRFLQEEESHQARRRGVQRWLLLLLRVLIVALLALAAARPHWGGLPGGGGRSVLFVLDASASMQAQQEDGRTRFAAAVDLAGEMAGSLPEGSSVHALLAGAVPRPLFAAWLPAGKPARTALAAAAPRDGPLDLAAALREAARLAGSAPSTPVEVVLLSDLQATTDADVGPAAAALAEAGGRLLIRPLGREVPGGGVLAVDLPGRALRPGEAVTVQATVRPEREGQVFWLELDGRRVAETLAPAPVAAGAPVTVTFPLTVPPAGRHVGRVGKEADRLPADDVRPFVLEVPDRLEVLLAHGPDRDGLGRGGWKYLARALDPEGAAQGLFRLRPVVADSLRPGDLAGVDLLILVDPGAPGRRLGEALGTWLEAGGALLLLAGDAAQVEDLRTALLPLLDLPRRATWVARSGDQGERARVVDAQHPLLADLGEAASEALAGARWWRYAAVAEGDARVVLASDAGAPLLLTGQRGEGRWALLPFHLRRDATDVMLNPVFLPLLQRLAAQLARPGDAATALTVGEAPSLRVPPQRLRLRPGEQSRELAVRVPPEGERRPVTLRWQGTVPQLTAGVAERAGVYTFTLAGDTLGVVAAAVPAGESEPRTLAAESFAAPLREAGLGRVLNLGDAGAAGLGRALAGHDLARWLLGAALALLAVEVWLGRRVR